MTNTEPGVDNGIVFQIANSLTENRDKWFTKVGSGADILITDSYYFVCDDGSYYGMGSASYRSTEEQKEILSKAVLAFSMERKKMALRRHSHYPAENMRFVNSVRDAFDSYKLHMNPVDFANDICDALGNLDNQISVIE